MSNRPIGVGSDHRVVGTIDQFAQQLERIAGNRRGFTRMATGTDSYICRHS
jgi:hypothetical protein